MPLQVTARLWQPYQVYFESKKIMQITKPHCATSNPKANRLADRLVKKKTKYTANTLTSTLHAQHFGQ